MKAPRSWPKSSDLSTLSDSAAQFSLMKGFLGARGKIVNCRRKHFLPGAGFTAQQDSRFRLRDDPDFFDHRSKRLLSPNIPGIVRFDPTLFERFPL